MTQRTIYFKSLESEEISHVLQRCNALAEAHNLGTSAADLLVALATGQATLRPAQNLMPTQFEELPLTQFLETVAAQIDNDAMAKELRRRRAQLGAVKNLL